MPDGLTRLFRPKISRVISSVKRAKTKAEEIRAKRRGKKTLRQLAKEIELQSKIERKQTELRQKRSIAEKQAELKKLKRNISQYSRFKIKNGKKLERLGKRVGII